MDILKVVFVVLLLVLMAINSATAQCTASLFAGGDGSSENPFQISNSTQLDNIRQCVDSAATYVLTSDLYLAYETDNEFGKFWNGGAGWEPIGGENNGLQGHFNGQGHKIIGLTIDRNSSNYVGFFGQIASNGSATDIILEDVSINGKEYTGAFVGANAGTLEKVGVTGEVNGAEYTGGFLGYNAGGTITQSFADVNVSGRYTRSSTTYVGGFSGVNSQSSSISNCFALGDVYAENGGAGGFIGINFDGSPTISKSYSTGSVSGGGNLGGFAGINFEGEISDSFWNTETSGTSSATGYGGGSISGLTTSEMQSSSPFTNAGWDLTNTWETVSEENDGFPNFSWYNFEPEAELSTDVSLDFDGSSYVQLDRNTGFPIHDQNQYTIEFWVKAPSGMDNQYLFTEASSSSGDPIFGLASTRENNNVPDGTRMRFIARDDNSDILVEDYTSLSVFDNTWHHVALVSNNGATTIYVDGKADATDFSYMPGTLTSDQTAIGTVYRSSANSSTGFEGKLKKIRFWGTARSQQDIRQTMFASLTGNESDLIAWYPIDNSSVNSFADESGNNNNALSQNGLDLSDELPPLGTFVTGTEGWRMMALPAEGATIGELFNPLWIQGFPGSDHEPGASNIRVWNESTHQFESISSASYIPTPGTAFIAYIYKDDEFEQPGSFPKQITAGRSQFTGTVYTNVSLTLTGSGDTYDAPNDGWNMVGNPYGATIDWDKADGWTKTGLDDVFYVWNNEANEYQSWNGASGTGELSNGLIAPFQAFWVKANNSTTPSLTIDDSARAAGGVFMKKDPVSQIQFELIQCSSERCSENGKQEADRQAEISSNAVLMFNDQAAPGKDRLDAWKLEPFSEQQLSLYTTDTERHALDINALPAEPESPLELNLDFRGFDLGGQYTLSWNPQNLPDSWADESVMLKDTHTDQVIDLSQVGEYSFEVDGPVGRLESPSGGSQGSSSEKSTRPKTQRPDGMSQPTHGPVPTVLKAKAKNPRFVLTVNPAGTNQLADIPETAQLDQNYPNPFNPETVISYGVPEQAQVQINVYDVLGRRVQTLINEQKSPGRYEARFDGSQLASGLYIYRLKVGSEVLTKKMMLIK